MAYVVAKSDAAFELRESRTTSRGPRSFTLATFKTLTLETIERARARSTTELDPAELRRAARRAGAPVAIPAADRLAAELVRELESGRGPRPWIKRMLADALAGGGGDPATSAGSYAAAGNDGKVPVDSNAGTARRGVPPVRGRNADAVSWIGASPQRHGEALHDVLLLADSIPARRPRAAPSFPQIDSGAH